MKKVIFFFQAEDGMRDLVRSRGLGEVYKGQDQWKEVEVGIQVKLEGLISAVNCQL